MNLRNTPSAPVLQRLGPRGHEVPVLTVDGQAFDLRAITSDIDAAFFGASLLDAALYSASKGAVWGLTLAMATDHVAEGIRVNCVSPGTVDTPLVTRMLAGFADPVAERRALDARQATGGMVTPHEVAMAVAYLASPLSGSTTGTSLSVDGGVTTLRVRPR